jgi:hypothetical protein
LLDTQATPRAADTEIEVYMTSRHRYGTVLGVAIVFFLLLIPGLPAQDGFGPALSDVSGIPEEYEDTVRDLVERYEEMRTLLREQIRLNTELYTDAELDAAITDLETELDQLSAENEMLRREYKTLLLATKNSEARTARYKEELVKTRMGLSAEIDTLERVIGSIEEERLLQLGATFSPAGTIGAIGTLNLPGTNVSLITQGIYDLRDKAFSTAFGVSFALIPQRSIVERFERFQNRVNDTETIDADPARDDTAGSGGATGAEPDDEDDSRSGGTLFRPNTRP